MEDNQVNQLPPTDQKPPENKKMIAGLCALMLGSFGIHKFILGYKTEGTILLVVNLVCLAITFITCGLAGIITIPILSIMGLIAMIEGIIYLTKTDEQFYETYQKNKKAWF